MFSNFVINLSCQSCPHFFNISLGSRFIWCWNVHFYPEIIVSPQLWFDLLHIKSASSKPMNHYDEHLFRGFKLFCTLNFRWFFEKYGSLDWKETIVKDCKNICLLSLEIFEIRFVLISELISKFISHLFLVTIHVHFDVSLESDHRLTNSFFDMFFELCTFCLEKLLSFLLKKFSNYLSPNLVYFLSIFVQQFFIHCDLLPFHLFRSCVKYFSSFLFLSNLWISFRIIFISFCFLKLRRRSK